MQWPLDPMTLMWIQVATGAMGMLTLVYLWRNLLRKLGFTLAFSEGHPPTFAGVNFGHVQIFLQKGSPSPEGCSVYFVVGNADELYEFHRANGVDVVEVPQDRPYQLRDYTVRDLSGYYLNFGHRLHGTAPTD